MSLSNSQYDTIKKIYDDRLLSRHREQEKRLAYVYEHVDGFREVDESISSLCVKQAELLLDGHPSALSDLKDSIRILKEQKALLLAQASLPADYLTVPYVCETCQDTGYHNGEKCHCFKQASLTLLYEQSNLKDYLNSTDFSNVSEEYYEGEDLVHFKDSYQKSINFVNNFKNDYQNLYFYGTVGTGKSFLSGCIAKALMKEGHSVIYFSASQLMNAISRSSFDYNKKNESQDSYNDILECDLLIIDDLGTEMINDFTRSQLFNCLNERYLRKKSVIISTNLSLKELRDYYSERIFSRIVGHFLFCKMTGPDIRKL